MHYTKSTNTKIGFKKQAKLPQAEKKNKIALQE